MFSQNLLFKKILKNAFLGLNTNKMKKMEKNNLTVRKGGFAEDILPNLSQSAITCSKLTIETTEEDMKYVQS